MFADASWLTRETSAWNGLSLPLETLSKLHSKDLDEVQAHMSAMLCDHDLHIEDGIPPIDFRHNQTQLRSFTFNATDYGNPYGKIVVGIPAVEQHYLVQFSLAGKAQITHDGKTFTLEPGQMCVLGSNAPTRQSFDAGYKHFTVKIPRSELDTVLLQELGFRPGELRFAPEPVPCEGSAASFAHMIRMVCDDIDFGLESYSHPRISGAIEDTLKRLLLVSVPHNHTDLFNGSATGPAPFYVRRVEEYIRAHAEEPVSLADMVEVSGVSARSLHSGFRRFRDTTPMGYLKNYRLNQARDMLKHGGENTSSVTNVALACGFTHLSKFARDYFDRFGERPSETLRSK